MSTEQLNDTSIHPVNNATRTASNSAARLGFSSEAQAILRKFETSTILSGIERSGSTPPGWVELPAKKALESLGEDPGSSWSSASTDIPYLFELPSGQYIMGAKVNNAVFKVPLVNGISGKADTPQEAVQFYHDAIGQGDLEVNEYGHIIKKSEEKPRKPETPGSIDDVLDVLIPASLELSDTNQDGVITAADLEPDDRAGMYAIVETILSNERYPGLERYLERAKDRVRAESRSGNYGAPLSPEQTMTLEGEFAKLDKVIKDVRNADSPSNSWKIYQESILQNPRLHSLVMDYPDLKDGDIQDLSRAMIKNPGQALGYIGHRLINIQADIDRTRNPEALYSQEQLLEELKQSLYTQLDTPRMRSYIESILQATPDTRDTMADIYGIRLKEA